MASLQSSLSLHGSLFLNSLPQPHNHVHIIPAFPCCTRRPFSFLVRAKQASSTKAAPVEPGRNRLDKYQILRYPVVTESSLLKIQKNNTLVFIVDARANKTEIKDVIMNMFNVQTEKINTLIRPDGKKVAFVKLAPSYNALNVAKQIGMF